MPEQFVDVRSDRGSARRRASLRKAIFNDDGVARTALEAIRWPDGPSCVACRADGKSIVRLDLGEDERSSAGAYMCQACGHDFDVTSASKLEEIHGVSLRTWMFAAYLFSSNGYREAALLRLEAEAGVTRTTALQLWDLVQRAAKEYRGYKHGFGKIVRAQMKVKSLSLWNYSATKSKLVSEGRHQSQNTIEATGILSRMGSREQGLQLDRTECLLRLVLAPRNAEKTKG